jgi:hypothetical protein
MEFEGREVARHRITADELRAAGFVPEQKRVAIEQGRC